MMVDLVFNHVGPVGTDFSRIYPFNSSEHYHDWCEINNWDDQWQVENCRLAALPDLKQENEWVTNQLIGWAQWIIANYSLDGIRIDTIKHVPKTFWSTLVSHIPNIYMLGETFSGDMDYLAGYTQIMPGQLSYPMYFTLSSTYKDGQSFWNINATLNGYNNAGIDYSVLGGFVDNHDNARFLNGSTDITRFKNALAFNLLTTSIPLVYYGSEQGYHGGADPDNREPLWASGFRTDTELYKFIAALAAERKRIPVSSPHIERYVDDNFYAFSRGKTLVCTTNQGQNMSPLTRSVTYLPFSDGTTVRELFTGDTATVNNGLQITIRAGEPQVWVSA
jgi:alpha-amylase